jgi:hypothetical protein
LPNRVRSVWTFNGKKFQKISTKETTKDQFKDLQALLYKLKDIQGLEFLFPNSGTFKDFQVLYTNSELSTHSADVATSICSNKWITNPSDHLGQSHQSIVVLPTQMIKLEYQ